MTFQDVKEIVALGEWNLAQDVSCSMTGCHEAPVELFFFPSEEEGVMPRPVMLCDGHRKGYWTECHKAKAAANVGET